MKKRGNHGVTIKRLSQAKKPAEEVELLTGGYVLRIGKFNAPRLHLAATSVC